MFQRESFSLRLGRRDRPPPSRHPRARPPRCPRVRRATRSGRSWAARSSRVVRRH